MKVFENETKVNFVDENNVLVGYDLQQSCCEVAGWFITSLPATIQSLSFLDNEMLDVSSYKQNQEEVDYSGYVFDVEYESLSIADEGKELYMEIFRLTKGDEELFVHLYNVHNGYYSHGFKVKHNDKLVREGGL